jgi:hypothetical protein
VYIDELKLGLRRGHSDDRGLFRVDRK